MKPIVFKKARTFFANQQHWDNCTFKNKHVKQAVIDKFKKMEDALTNLQNEMREQIRQRKES